ncbi:Peroxisomal membrane protein PMP27 [Serendipita sp. 399]|nr:Peroxisomal membrane protein PMP27 [Serendipita sp. 399]
MRLGKPLEHLQAALKASQSIALPQQSAERYTAVARHLCYAGYLAFDSIVWANTIKFVNLVPTKAEKVLKISLRFWLVGIMVGQAGRLANEAKRLKTPGEKSVGDRVENDTRLKALERERAAVRYQLLLDVLDMWIPATGLGIVNFNDGIIGLLGVVTSIMAFKSQWNSIQMG